MKTSLTTIEGLKRSLKVELPVDTFNQKTEKIIKQNLKAPSIFELIYSPEIYIPLLAFFGLLIFTIIARKIFYKN